MIFWGLIFIFLMTILGSSLVYVIRGTINDKLNSCFLGLASGIMLSASIWSLLVPAISYANELNIKAYIPIMIGFILGVLFMVLLDKPVKKSGQISKAMKFFTAVTIHNIPEGLAVGLAFGLAIINNLSLWPPMLFAIGIGIQNIPEGIAIALPMYEKTKSKTKAFMFGAGSGLVEPIFGFAGLFLAKYVYYVMPYALALAAGAMIFVIFDDLLPDIDLEYKKYGVWSIIIGFLVMMLFDLAL